MISGKLGVSFVPPNCFRITLHSGRALYGLPIIRLWRLEATAHETKALQSKTQTSKSILRLPDLEVAKTAVINSLSCPDAQRGYRHAIDEFVDWYCSEPRLSFSKTVVVRYRMHLESRHLAPGTINLRLGAVRRLAYCRPKPCPRCLPFGTASSSNARRNYPVVRKSIDPIRYWGVTEKLIWHVVKEFAAKIGSDRVAPHDLRRTCARLCRAAGGELEQIQFLLGHVSVQTTERYLGCTQ